MHELKNDLTTVFFQQKLLSEEGKNNRSNWKFQFQIDLVGKNGDKETISLSPTASSVTEV